MSAKKLFHFQQLKQAIVRQLQLVYPSMEGDIHAWKGQEIQLLQQDLVEKVQGRVSEKWFYTHLKPEKNEKLPRIDLLNLLCRYVGFEGWQDFLESQNHSQIEIQDSTSNEIEGKKEMETASIQDLKTNVDGLISPFSFLRHFSSIKPIAAGLIVVVALVSFLGNAWMIAPKKYTFCFFDADSGKAIEGQAIEVTFLHEKESPIVLNANEQGCIELKGKMKEVKMVVNSAYYRKDTIVRVLDKQKRKEKIRLRTDDYALMIHIFSTSKLKDWQKRREQLDDMIAEDAQIIQVDSANRLGMEIYNKSDFVNKLTMPIKSLKNIEVLQTQYDSKGKIVLMRFTQKN